MDNEQIILLWAVFATVLLPLLALWQYRLLRRQSKRVLFLLDAVENNDTSIHFNEHSRWADSRLVNKALNRMVELLSQTKANVAQQEKYYELILNTVRTGIIVLDDKGYVVQHNNEALRLLGLNIFTHVQQLNRIAPVAAKAFETCTAGRMQLSFNNERDTVALSIRVSDITVRNQHLRILALNDIHSELDEKEIDSWIRLTRVLTHEIMNSITPITSLSDTLLKRAAARDGQSFPKEKNFLKEKEILNSEIIEGLDVIHTTGKNLLTFVENYRKFTHIPSPVPTLFYVKDFVNRMIGLAQHQHFSFTDSADNSGKAPHPFPIDFHSEVTPGDLLVYADESLTSQVMINLLKNAVQAIENQGVQMTGKGHISIFAYTNAQDAVVIEVSNNGPLIAPEDAEQIFTPFFTTKPDGSGIGLSIARQIMRLQNGSLTLKQEKQTCFVLTFN